ncbi:hypothetical protein [Arthrobacter sp. LFS091]|uniref:hypothetical protein n=1 Tax=Arthrobacter sp. LFS091 TaxID=3229892 RepID=UPI003A80FCD5
MNSQDDDMEPTFSPLPEQIGTGPLGKGAVAASAAAVSIAFPPIAIPVAGVTAALQAYGDRLNKHQQERIDQVVGAASGKSGLTPIELINRCTEDEDLRLAFAEAVDAARRSRLQGKAASLGNALGAILSDDALIDQETVWIRILSVVEPPHIRVLRGWVYPSTEPGSDTPAWSSNGTRAVFDVAGQLSIGHGILPLVQDLIGAGLLMAPLIMHQPNVYQPGDFNRMLAATGLGVELFARLQDGGTELK